MPFKSDAQRRFMFAAEDRGELPKGTAKNWAHHTPDIKNLPERVKKHKKTAAELAGVVLEKTAKMRDRSKEIGGFQSKAQQRFMFAAEARGDLPKGKAREWARDTPNIKQLPEKVKKTASELADAALAVTPFTGALRDFYEGGKWAPGGVVYEGPFKIANQVPVAQRETGSLAQSVLTKIGYTLTPEQYAMLSPTAQDYDTGGHVGRMLGAPVGLGLGLKYLKEPKSALFRALLGLSLGSLGGGVLGSGIGAGVGAWKERNSPEVSGEVNPMMYEG